MESVGVLPVKGFGCEKFYFSMIFIYLGFFGSHLVNTGNQKKGIKQHKRYVRDMCRKNTDCKHFLLLFFTVR